MIAALLIAAAETLSAFQSEARQIAQDEDRLCAVVMSAPVDAAALGGEWRQVGRRIEAALEHRSPALADSLKRDGRRAWLKYQSQRAAVGPGVIDAQAWHALGLARSALAVALADSARLKRTVRECGKV